MRRAISAGWVAILLLVSCGPGSRPAASGGPWSRADMVELGGDGALGIFRGGERVSYHDGGHFALAVYLQNNSRRPLTIVNAENTDKGVRLIRQVGVRFTIAHRRSCPKYMRCPPPSSYLGAPFGSEKAVPALVSSGQVVAIQLNYEMTACGAVSPGLKTYGATMNVSYRYPGDKRLRSQFVSLAGEKLLIYAPTVSDCRARGRSRLILEGSGISTSADWALPGTGGDSCRYRRSGRELIFEGAAMQIPGPSVRPALSSIARISFLIPAYHGAGVYRVGRNGTRVRVTVAGGAAGVVSKLDARGGVITVLVAKNVGVAGRSGTVSGRLRAELSPFKRLQMRKRAYGPWYCAISP